MSFCDTNTRHYICLQHWHSFYDCLLLHSSFSGILKTVNVLMLCPFICSTCLGATSGSRHVSFATILPVLPFPNSSFCLACLLYFRYEKNGLGFSLSVDAARFQNCLLSQEKLHQAFWIFSLNFEYSICDTKQVYFNSVGQG